MCLASPPRISVGKDSCLYGSRARRVRRYACPSVYVFWFGAGGRSNSLHRRHNSLYVLRGGLWNMVGATIPSQVAAMQVVALGGFLLVFLLSGLIFPIENIPVDCVGSRISCGPVLHRSRAGCATPRWRLARRLVEGRDHRPHRLGFLRGWMVQHAPNAAQSVSVVK